MATRLFSDDQMERLRSYPDIGKDELIRFFTLTPADVVFVDRDGLDAARAVFQPQPPRTPVTTSRTCRHPQTRSP